MVSRSSPDRSPNAVETKPGPVQGPDYFFASTTGEPSAAAPPRRLARDAEPVGPIAIDLERASRFIAEIREIELGEAVLEAVDGYDRVGQRNAFLWKWVRRGVEITSLSSIEEARWDDVCDTKVLGVMFDVLVDDVADESGDAVYLERLIDIAKGRPAALDEIPPAQREHYEFSRRVWESIRKRLETYPRFEEFYELLLFDYRQLMNAMRYSLLIRHYPASMNISEHDAYLPHNMHMMVSGTIDLMASERFDIGELGRLRTILTCAQYMGRIGNLVTTWEREIRERDFSSGVFAMALSLGVLTAGDLVRGEEAEIARKIREAEIERRFLVRWRKFHDRILRMRRRVATVDVGKLVEGLETLIQLHLGSRGLK